MKFSLFVGCLVGDLTGGTGKRERLEALALGTLVKASRNDITTKESLKNYLMLQWGLKFVGFTLEPYKLRCKRQ